jgi:hypothetical protein
LSLAATKSIYLTELSNQWGSGPLLGPISIILGLLEPQVLGSRAPGGTSRAVVVEGVHSGTWMLPWRNSRRGVDVLLVHGDVLPESFSAAQTLRLGGGGYKTSGAIDPPTRVIAMAFY